MIRSNHIPPLSSSFPLPSQFSGKKEMKEGKMKGQGQGVRGERNVYENEAGSVDKKSGRG